MKFIIRRGAVVLSLTADPYTPSFLSVDPDTFSDIIVSQDTASPDQLGPGVYNKPASCFSSQVGWVKFSVSAPQKKWLNASDTYPFIVLVTGGQNQGVSRAILPRF